MKRGRLTWSEKLLQAPPPHTVLLERSFADVPAGSRLLITSPAVLDQFVRTLPPGTTLTVKELRQQLARQAQADHTCPLTTGIFLRIVAEAAWEQFQTHQDLTQITPFWRVVDPPSPLARKLACGKEFIQKQRDREHVAATSPSLPHSPTVRSRKATSTVPQIRQ